jgi:hypothetical protein
MSEIIISGNGFPQKSIPGYHDKSRFDRIFGYPTTTLAINNAIYIVSLLYLEFECQATSCVPKTVFTGINSRAGTLNHSLPSLTLPNSLLQNLRRNSRERII